MGFRVKTAFRWKDGIIPYEFSAEASKTIPQKSGVRETVISVMRLWEAYTNEKGIAYFRFRERQDGETPFLSIQGSKDSTGGEIALSGLKQGDKSTVLLIGHLTFINAIPHEVGHVLGLYHEHERSLANKSVLKYVAKATPQLCPIVNSIAEYKTVKIGQDIKDNLRVPVGLYDLCSIMHYPTVDKQWEFNCTELELAEYLKEHKLDHAFGNNDQGAAVVNYPTADEVQGRRWAPSHGDIAALRELYKPE